MQKFSSALLTIDLTTVDKNLQLLKKKAGEVMPMVKANAYGTCALKLARFFEEKKVPLIGVSHLNEAVFLRENGIKVPIFVIHVPYYEAELAVSHDLDSSVSLLSDAEVLAACAKKMGKKARVHLTINTGMNRFGVRAQDAGALADYISSSPHLQFEGITTHFSCSERSDLDLFTFNQIDTFKAILDKLKVMPRWIHAANTFGAMRFELPFCNLARIGLGIYQSALTLESRLSFVSSASKGECVGYNCHYQIEKDNFRIGVIPLGYHDGFKRTLSEKGYVLIRGKKASMIGHICMDYMMVDLTDIPEAKVMDTATLFNPHQLTPETVASWGNIDVRELLVSLGPRVERVFIKEPAGKLDEKRSKSERLSSTF